jgi:hypothetical protein
VFNATKAIYARALKLGYAKSDTAVVCAVLERKKP